RPGEVLFALPLRLETVNRSNVREGPGAGYAVAFTLETGAPVVGYSYADQWVHIGDEAGRSGWMFQTLVGRRQTRSEEHTSELQSRGHLVCRLLLEKKKK